MKPAYSYKKTLLKGISSALGSLIFLVAFTQFADVAIWDLMVQYVKPVVGGMTVVGALKMAHNYIKFNYLS